MPRLIDEFPLALNRCDKEYNRHYPQKGDSWKNKLEKAHLEVLLHFAIHDYLEKVTGPDYPIVTPEALDQLVDVVNLALMVIERHEMEVCRD